MRVNRSLLFWGLGLVTAGLVALLILQGYVDRSALGDVWRLWPLILVAIGLAVISARTPFALAGTALAAIVAGAIVGAGLALGPGLAFSCGGDNQPATTTTRTGTLSGNATLAWQLNCASVDVSTASNDGSWNVRFGTDGAAQPRVDSGADRLSLQSATTSGIFDSRRERWVVGLPTAATYRADIHSNGGALTMKLAGSTFASLSMEPNAVNVFLDLTDAHVSGLDVHLNAGKLVIVANAGTMLEGQIETNAAGVELCAPSDASMRITASGTAFGTNLDDSDLKQTGDTWESASYADANPNQTITLTVHGNAASFDLNPEEGCS